MNIYTKFFFKYLLTTSKNILKSSYTMIKKVSFQGCKDDTKYADQ
jgi:hypothetical protein